MRNKPNAIIRAWRSVDGTMTEICGEVWDYGKWLAGIAATVGLYLLFMRVWDRLFQ